MAATKTAASSDPTGKSRRNTRLASIRRLKILAIVGGLFFTIQYYNLFGIPGKIKNYIGAKFLKDPEVAWASRFYRDFAFTLQTSDGCKEALKLLPSISQLDATDAKAQADWTTALKACHGPLPEADKAAMEELSLSHFWDQLTICATKGGCLPEWQQAMRGRNSDKKSLQKLFVESAACALQTEFPFSPLMTHEELAPMKDKKPSGWNPKRILLLSVTLGPEGPGVACKLVATALTRGWNLTLVEGPQRGLEYRFSDALATLHGMLLQEPDIKPEDTLVIFVDPTDILMQQSPMTIVKKFLDQPYEFVFSADEKCHPMGEFPHSVAAKEYVCDHLFPYSDGWGIRSGPQYVNTGGWIATANAASVVLKELVEFVQRFESNCLKFGKDEMLGSLAFLRHRALVGLDTNYEIFSGGSAELMQEELTLQTSTNNTKNLAYCHAHYKECPGMLHFNGHMGDEEKMLQSAFGVLTSTKAIQKCPSSAAWGSLTLVKRTGNTIKTVYKDAHLENSGHREWKRCLSGMACFGK